MTATLSKPMMTHASRLEEMLRSNAFFLVCILGAALLSYGYELFGFHLTIDEEAHSEFHFSSPWAARSWLGQGRWGMALLNTIVLRQTVVPVVSGAIGVAGVAAGLTLFLSVILRSRIAILAGVIFGLSFPTLAFAITFSTLAYGLGVGAVCTALFLCHSHANPYGRRLVAICLGAFAIAIYQPFVFAITIGMLCVVFERLSASRDLISAWTVLQRNVSGLIAAIMLYTVIDRVMRYVFSVQIEYVQGFVDVGGLLANPFGRFADGTIRVLDVFKVSPTIFGTGAVLMTAVLCLAGSSLIFVSIRGKTGSVLTLATFLVIIAVLIMAQAITPNGVPLRSMIYVTFFVAALVGLALERVPDALRIPYFVLALCAAIDGASVANRLFLSADLVYAKDRQLAVDLAQQIHAQLDGGSRESVREIYVAGSWSWPPTNLTPKTETFGASFFEWEEGNRWRIASILKLNSDLSMTGATPDGVRLAAEMIPAMPVWPGPGSVEVSKGVALVKFSDFSPTQRKEMCRLEIKRYCD